MGKPLKVEDLKAGQQVYVVPQRAGVSMGVNLGPFPARGRRVRVDDYIVGLVRRGVVIAHLQEPPRPQPMPVPEPQPQEPAEPEDR